MSTYLTIAEQILEEAEQPLTAKEILSLAYQKDLVPSNLYGKTQHKTLQARISVDIRKRGDESAFYRTSRGVFFLTKLRNAPFLTEKQQQGILARPRFRELNRQPVLSVVSDNVKAHSDKKGFIEKSYFKEILSYTSVKYSKLKELKKTGDYPVWAFVVVKKDDTILTYRHGRYRESRDGFLNQRTIGFKTLVNAKDKTFLDNEDFGLTTAGLVSTYADLGVPLKTVNVDQEKNKAEMEFLLAFDDVSDETELVCILTYDCPDWLEPFKRRLAINDLSWLKTSHAPNNLEDFDDWSQKILPELFAKYNAKQKVVS